jgi:hypothetical protein
VIAEDDHLLPSTKRAEIGSPPNLFLSVSSIARPKKSTSSSDGLLGASNASLNGINLAKQLRRMKAKGSEKDDTIFVEEAMDAENEGMQRPVEGPKSLCSRSSLLLATLNAKSDDTIKDYDSVLGKRPPFDG